MQHWRADAADTQPMNHSYQSQSAPGDVNTERNADHNGQRSCKVLRPAHRHVYLVGEEISDTDIEAGPDQTADRIHREKGGGRRPFGSSKRRQEGVYSWHELRHI